MNAETAHREIPFNYTSADDRQAISWLLGSATWQRLEELRTRRVTGRSARLLMRVFGELLVHRRNPFLYQELADDTARRRAFFRDIESNLHIIETNAAADPILLDVMRSCRRLLQSFHAELTNVPRERQRILARLAPIVGRDNILFDPFTLVSHSTDATDWRLHLPVGVVMPEQESQVAPVLAAIAELGLFAIPRGAGTGLTGGAVPLRPGCIVINTEKLNRIRAITKRDNRHTISLEAGVITEHAMEHAAEHQLVFATDPTSAWASTIGGNIAENAGGKTAVLWGTCIDNLLAYEMAMPDGSRRRIERLDHPMRKILPDDVLAWRITDSAGEKIITLRGDEIRRNGLWKDITNKTLRGLPGIQKEGTDGIITSAEFVLYPQYEASATLCLEFFGPDMDEASRVILEIVRAFPIGDAEVLQALEHFDDEYVRAIGYKVKAPRVETPKAVLLVDVVGHTPAEVARGVERIRAILARHGNTALFEAKDKTEAKLFWDDRKKFGAITARTNAFKLNEDVVLPLEALAEFARFCDTLNLEEERHAQHTFIRRAETFLKNTPLEGSPWLAEKIPAAIARCQKAITDLAAAGGLEVRGLAVTESLREDLRQLVRGYDTVTGGLDAMHAEERRRRIVIATHMHAGDGNVHVNIPVLSNDRAMIRHAEWVVDLVMEKVAALGGVCSGEHGIGVTKLKYLEPARIAELTAYRQEADPRGIMNPGKLSDLEAVGQIFTPSFNLLELEARILQHGKLEELAVKIANCVRCGKCKPDCCVFHPACGLFYHPRNKNLAIGALIEALLYEAQRERAARFGMLRFLEDVADHCTICHKCLKPCPVAIDTGVVSVLEREILVAHGYKHTAAATRATLQYLESRSPAFNAVFRAGVVRAGGAVQRACARSGLLPLPMLQSPVPAAEAGTLRDVLPRCEPHQALVLEPDGEAAATVFYFPGCGSERLHSSVSMAALHVLLETGTRVVLPPPFLCCGFPHKANAAADQHGRIVLRDTIVFAQIREMFAHVKFNAVIVTCGTCRESLDGIETAKIFGAPIMDVARFAAERGLKLERNGRYLYHTPCHDSLEGKAAAVMEAINGSRLESVPHCCSEAGTLSLSRPDIADAMLHRKAAALQGAMAGDAAGPVILTNCPSCLQGLGRNVSLGVRPRHLAVELAEQLSGSDWREKLRVRAARAQAFNF
jgi:FAD/FMN-containing dehydrogenase/Fe-S oxidoreductase